MRYLESIWPLLFSLLARANKVPSYEIVCETLDYLRSLGLIDDDDDLYEFLKKFPGVLISCGLEHELRSDVKILEKDQGIKGKSLQKLLLRNVD